MRKPYSTDIFRKNTLERIVSRNAEGGPMYPIELHGPRVTLREYVPDDAEAVLAFAAHPKVFARVGDEAPPVLADVRAWLGSLAPAPGRTRHEVAIVVDGRVVGSVGLTVDGTDAEVAELGYVVHPDWWGRGVATEAAGLLTRYGFTDLGLRRVHAGVSADNPASHRVLEKIGMRRQDDADGLRYAVDRP
jgi:RimJ/RimL family protein N-acetyltransferase